MELIMAIARDWKDPQAYAFCEKLTSAQWAWEFLRRNPEYQHQWRQFWHTWQQLEEQYGKPPNRDFCAWKNDPRAWVPAAQCADGECRVDQDKVLIECALGARWGFYKFPPDPEDDDPVGAGRLVWRPQSEAALPRTGSGRADCDAELELGLCFDLSMPLKPQLEQARRQLQMEAALRRREGRLRPKRVAVLAPHWTRLLRLLDARQSGAVNQELMELESPQQRWREAEQLLQGGYLKLLQIPN